MDGSEPGESVAAAVLSGAPVDLQARTVRYVCAPSPLLRPCADIDMNLQHLPPDEDRHTIRGMALASLAYGLGPSAEGTPMGESPDGMAIIG